MSAKPISERLRNFIFEHLDSAECLEILLLMHATPERSWSADQLAVELRSNPNSAFKRAQLLRATGILVTGTIESEFQYRSDLREMTEVIDELAYHNKIQRHKLYELIFSPLKRARDFAAAFKKPGSREGNNDG